MILMGERCFFGTAMEEIEGNHWKIELHELTFVEIFVKHQVKRSQRALYTLQGEAG